ncbi:MAG: hypothetical protein APF82_09100 [Sphingomonadales bacterium BRH_c42]|nr:MAG: hypothetical protein APF82_09100 [Sphingomonadales bacterium BRH_c42]
MFKKALLSGTLALCAVASPAQASVPLALTMPGALPLAAVGMAQIGCGAAPAAPANPLSLGYASRSMSKSAAILGGQSSALELMRMQQGGGGGGGLPVANSILGPATSATNSYAPALPLAAIGSACLGLPQGLVLRAPLPLPARSTGAFLGSERIAIGRTRYDAEWRRVSSRGLSQRDLTHAIGTVPQDRDALLARVNRWVNRKIDYRDDRQSSGTRDYWADAATTLRRGSGDCEDFAILKMQMLAAAGIDRDDMMLTLARDTLRQVDHAVLLVRSGAGWSMLDLQSDRVVPAGGDYGYRAVLSFSGESRWLHGQAVTTPAQPAMRLAFN